MKEEPGKRRKKWGLAAAAAAIAVTLGIFAVMALMTLPSADDFWYRYFLDGGLRNYLSIMKSHYLYFNGRVLVHVVDHIVLHLGNWCFAAVGILLLCFIPVALNAASGRERGLIPWTMALFLPTVLSLPRSVLNQGILWISAFFNYVLPTAMLTGQVLLFELLQKRRDRGGLLLGAACVLWSTLCGATTEQSGFAAVLLAAYFLLKALIVKRDRAASALSLLGSAAGLLTIFASPATRTRMRSGASLGSLREIVSTMYENMGPCAKELCTSWLAPVALAAFFALAGAAARRRTGKRWPLFLSLLPAAASIAAAFCPDGVRTALFVALCFAAAAAAGTLMALGEEAAGSLVMAGLSTFAVILVTDSVGGRTLVPFLLTLSAADAVLLSSHVRDMRGAWSCAAPTALLLLGIMAAVPFIGGLRYNLTVDRENRENTLAARETGVLNYCLDYDMDYTCLKLQTDFMTDYLAGEGLPADTEVRYFSRLRPQVEIDGEIQYPAYVTEEGETLFWIRLVEPLGGQVQTRPGEEWCLTVVLPWAQCDIDTDGRKGTVATFTRTDIPGVPPLTGTRFSLESRTWFPLEAYTDIMGFKVTYDAQRNTYIFSAPEE